jgi:hypothetical protein
MLVQVQSPVQRTEPGYATAHIRMLESSILSCATYNNLYGQGRITMYNFGAPCTKGARLVCNQTVVGSIPMCSTPVQL